MKFSNDALVLMAHICNPRRYALPERMQYQWFLSQFHAAFATTIESSSSSSIPLTSNVHDDSKISKATNDHQDKAVKESVLLDRAKDDKNANDINDVDSVSFVLKEPDLGRLAVGKTVVDDDDDDTTEEQTNCLTFQDSEASTGWLNCASSVGPYNYVEDASSETEPCPYGSHQEESFYAPLPSYAWDSGAYFTSSQEEEESAYGYSFNEEVPSDTTSTLQDTSTTTFSWTLDGRELQPASDCNSRYVPEPDYEGDDATKLNGIIRNCYPVVQDRCKANVPLKCWDVTAFTNMQYAFKDAPVPADVSFWDFSKVTSARRMFHNADLSNVDMSTWKFDSLKDMNRLFREAKNIGDISAWDVSRVTKAWYIFENADLSKAGISNWKFDSMEDMSFLFYNAKNIGDLSAWDVSRITSMEFTFAHVDKPPQGLQRWDVSEVGNMISTFRGLNWDWNADAFGIAHWDVSKVTTMNNMFQYNTYFPSAIWRWDVRNVKGMGNMFYQGIQSTDFVKNAHLQMWDFHEEVDMNYMFGPTRNVEFVTDFADKNDHDLVRRLCSYFDFVKRRSGFVDSFEQHFSTWSEVPDDNGVQHIDCYCPNGEKKTVNPTDFHNFPDCVHGGICPYNLEGSQPGCWDIRTNKVNLHPKDRRFMFEGKAVPGGVWGWDITNLELLSFFTKATFNEPLGIRKWKMKSQTEEAGPLVDLFYHANFGNYFDSVVIDKAGGLMFRGASTDDGPLSKTHELGGFEFQGTSEQLAGWTNRQIKNLAPYIRFTREQWRDFNLAQICPTDDDSATPTITPTMSKRPVPFYYE